MNLHSTRGRIVAAGVVLLRQVVREPRHLVVTVHNQLTVNHGHYVTNHSLLPVQIDSQRKTSFTSLLSSDHSGTAGIPDPLIHQALVDLLTPCMDKWAVPSILHNAAGAAADGNHATSARQGRGGD